LKVRLLFLFLLIVTVVFLFGCKNQSVAETTAAVETQTLTIPSESASPETTAAEDSSSVDLQKIQEEIDNINTEPQLDISAQSALIMRYDDGKILWGKNATEIMYPASITKILTGILAIENITDFSKIVEINEVESGYYSVTFGLQVKDKITLSDLLKATLIDSHCGAAIALADYIAGDVENFSFMMNEKAKNLGAATVNFENPNGLDTGGSRNLATAVDIALIARYCMQNDLFREIVGTKVDTITVNSSQITLWSTNHLLSLDYIKGIKTGYTMKAGQCVVLYSDRDEQPLIIVLLKCDSAYSRSNDAKILIDWASKNYQNT
jgi:serine-type D-Ala-D-Ala carboxypeptidase (penicillin-binding protein 5/6)